METSADTTVTNRTTSRTDEAIQRDVLAELEWDARLIPAEIGVAVKDGVVTLTGRVDSYLKRWAAEQAAHRVRAVKAVANDIEVRLPSSDDRSDADIAAAAARAIEWDAELPSDTIKVTVENGWVTLRGEVEWQFQRVDVERVVRRLKGVQGVTNSIVVSPRVTPSNVKNQIEDALVRSVKTDAEHITVEAEDGKVVLKGEVRSYAERDEAERAAWMAPGVKSVENKIIVSYS